MIKPKNTVLIDRMVRSPRLTCTRNSCRTYASTLRRIAKLHNVVFNADLKWLMDPNILKTILKLENLNTLRNLVNSAAIGLQLLGTTDSLKLRERYMTQLKVLNERVDAWNKSGKLTAKQKTQTVSWSTIEKLRRITNREVQLGKMYQAAEVTWSILSKIQENLVLFMYTTTPPTRLEWSDLRFFSSKEINRSDPPKGNILVMGPGKEGYKIYWSDTKTSKTMGIQLLVVPKVLARLLKKHVRFMKKFWPENRQLLLNSSFKPMTRNGLSKFMTRMFQKRLRKKLSVSALRRIFLTDRFSKSELEEAREIHRKMGHKHETALNWYIKKKEDV
jgi:hypothetical protein